MWRGPDLRRSRLRKVQKLGGQLCSHHRSKLMVYGVVPFCLRFILIPGGKSHITQVEVCIDKVYA